MKKNSSLLLLLAAALIMPMAACSNSEPNPDPNPDPAEKDYHFDIWVALDRHGGMARDVQTLVRSMGSLEEEQPEITFEGVGTEVNSILTLETIYKDAYYYQVPVSADRFAKYAIDNNTVKLIAAHPFRTNTYSPRKYTHAWLSDNTLLIMAANGKADKIIWTKLNAEDMSVIAEGTMDIPLPPDAKVFTTSGIAAYRKSDNKLFYFYYGKSAGSRGKRTTPFYIAVINPDDMKLLSNELNGLSDEMVGSAYGELLQPITLVDNQNNLYIACFKTENGVEKSQLLKIPAGQTKFDSNYNGFTNQGKLVAVIYVGNGKALAYARDDSKGTEIDSYSHYYAIIDLPTASQTNLEFGGKMLPYSGGRFSCRMAAEFGKAYLGVNPENSNPGIYIYDSNTGSLIKGVDMKEGYYFEQIRILKNIVAE